jgi:hypothetical protein
LEADQTRAVRKVSLEQRRGEAGCGGVGGSGSGGDAAHTACGAGTNSANGATVYACGDAAYNRPQCHRDPQARDYQLAYHLKSS